MNGFNPSYVGDRDDILVLLDRAGKNIKNVGSFLFGLNEIRKNQNVLDIGCSTGALGAKLKESYHAEVVGIEIDESMAKIAEARLDKVIVGDIEEIEFGEHFRPGYFDRVICADILEHLKDPWSLLKKMTTFLRDEGLVIASIPNIRHYTVIMNLLFRGAWEYKQRGIFDKGHLRFFTLRSIKELFEGAGLKVVIVKRNYRLIEEPHGLNKCANFFALPGIRGLLVFQYLIIAKKLHTV